jgi:pimeloyl-ACP methyl ester carboxylesterase
MRIPRVACLAFWMSGALITAHAQQSVTGGTTGAPPPARPIPPTRSPDAPGAPPFIRIETPGVNPPTDTVGNYIIGPNYVRAPEFNVVEGVPQGRVEQFTMESKDSKYYPMGIVRDEFGKLDPDNAKTLIVPTHDTPYTRTVTVYIPAQYVPGTAAPFIIQHDGPALGQTDVPLAHVLDNLIAQKRVPVQIAILIAHGGGDGMGSERGREYDTVSGKYAEFIEAEVLPLVEKTYHVTLTKDPDARAVMGNSSGGAAAFIMAWFHPDLYRRVITTSGTFVNQQWPFNPELPDGAWSLHEKLIPESPRKPIRLWMGVGDADLLNPGVIRDGMHDWVDANHRMAKVLAEKGYRYQYVFALGVRHGLGDAKFQVLPEALEWVWKDYQPPPPPTDYTTIHMEVAVNRSAPQAWAKIGKFCDISAWLGVDCTLTAGDGGIGSVRALRGGAVTEVLIAQTPLSYGYTQPAKEGKFYNLYHGFLEARPVTSKTSKILYTLFLDESDKPSQAARDADVAMRRSRFEAALQTMKRLAEAK